MAGMSRGRRSRRTHAQRQRLRRVHLRQREIDHRLQARTWRPVDGIAHDADDLERHHRRPLRTRLELAAHGRPARQVLPRERLVDDGDARRRLDVVLVEVASLTKGNAVRLEPARCHGIDPCKALALGQRLDAGSGLDDRVPSRVARGRDFRPGGHRHARQGFDLLPQAVEPRRRLLVRQAGSPRCRTRRPNPDRIPIDAVVRAVNVRRNSAPPSTSASDNATWPTTSTFRTPIRRSPMTLRPCSLSASFGARRATPAAGARPKSSAVRTATPAVNASTRQSGARSSVTASRPES